MLILASIVYSLAVGIFLSPLKISPGGLTGIATAVNFMTDVPTGLILVFFNIPLIILGFIKFGGGFIFKTTVSVLFTSVFIDLAEAFLKSALTDKAVCSVFGGLLLGIGIGVTMLTGASTGGADIAVKLVNRRFNISIGRAFLIIDGAVIIFASIIYGDIQSALYSVITIFVSSKTVDIILYGNNDAKALFIISERREELSKLITEKAERGVTLLSALGGYTGKSKNVLLCVARNNEINLIRKAIINTDPSAFFFIVSVGDVIGKGFK